MFEPVVPPVPLVLAPAALNVVIKHHMRCSAEKNKREPNHKYNFAERLAQQHHAQEYADKCKKIDFPEQLFEYCFIHNSDPSLLQFFSSQHPHAVFPFKKDHVLFYKMNIDRTSVFQAYCLVRNQSDSQANEIEVDNLIVSLILGMENFP